VNEHSSLRISGLKVVFHTQEADVLALDTVDMSVNKGESVAVIGESGCGKSVLAHAIMRLLDDIANVEGNVEFDGKQIYCLHEDELRNIRGAGIGLIPQNPQGAFNPVSKIGEHFFEVLSVKKGMNKKQSLDAAEEILGRMGFDKPSEILNTYAHRLSGGMCERVLIGLARSTDPKLLIADEPTKGLDTLSKKRMLEYLHKIRGDSTLIMITHDFPSARTCQRTCVMYAGEIVEDAPTDVLMKHPMHPYSKGLMMSEPENGMIPIPGRYSVQSRSSGCRFKDRCSMADPRCDIHPELRDVSGSKVRCHLA